MIFVINQMPRILGVFAVTGALACAQAQAATCSLGTYDPLSLAVNAGEQSVSSRSVDSSRSRSLSGCLVVSSNLINASYEPIEAPFFDARRSLASHGIDGSKTGAFGGRDLGVGTSTSNGMICSWSNSANCLSGDNHLAMSGKLGGSAQGPLLHATATDDRPGTPAPVTPALAVPEPYSVLLASLGLMGFLTRRRQRNLSAD